METVRSRASIAWVTSCPNRPKPTIKAQPSRSLATSTSSMEGVGLGSNQRSASTHSGVSAIEMMTTAVSTAPVCASKIPAAAAAP
ncbi:hypothetical protein G6F24_018810 [Rhizopus arrhizus]|nr:hypothetical protein G6F24_018810 [Rhizopus arrhizus]